MMNAPHLYKSLHFQTYSFNRFFVQTITYILLSLFACYVHSCMILTYSCSCLSFSSASPKKSFLLRMIAMLVRNGGLSGDLINTFVLHNKSMSWSFISMIGCWIIDNQNFYSLEHGVEPSIVFYESFLSSQGISVEVANLRKLGQKMDWVYIASLTTTNIWLS